jgi:RAQPRD family integrative conjugative element protein
MMKSFWIFLFFLLGFMPVANAIETTVDTTTENEKRYLIKIANELAYLQELTRKAKQSADPHARISLDYVALEQDLQEIRRALETHITAPSRTPRQVNPLDLSVGDYQ